jgi:hypothetical protein
MSNIGQEASLSLAPLAGLSAREATFEPLLADWCLRLGIIGPEEPALDLRLLKQAVRQRLQTLLDQKILCTPTRDDQGPLYHFRHLVEFLLASKLMFAGASENEIRQCLSTNGTETLMLLLPFQDASSLYDVSSGDRHLNLTGARADLAVEYVAPDVITKVHQRSCAYFTITEGVTVSVAPDVLENMTPDQATELGGLLVTALVEAAEVKAGTD